MKQVTIYTDGACSGNPGPGGWGAILQYGAHEKEISGGERQTTNNRLLDLLDTHEVTFHWVKGHAENRYNNRCDELAVAEWKKFR